MTEEAVNHHYRGTRQWCGALPGGIVLLWPGNAAGYGLGVACSGTCVYRLWVFSSLDTRLSDAA